MLQTQIFKFKNPPALGQIPAALNNPFGKAPPPVACSAATEFQGFLAQETGHWNYNFGQQKGKMFGVLVVQKPNKEVGYLGAVSGKLPQGATQNAFAPSVFDAAADNFFINRGMTQLTQLSQQIARLPQNAHKQALVAKRKQHSLKLQQRLFEHYSFVNNKGQEKELLTLFKEKTLGKPPVGAGDCAAPKLLNYAFKNQLKPLALAEFWWGNPPKNNDKKHQQFYPACKDRCRPILEFMLGKPNLYLQAQGPLAVN